MDTCYFTTRLCVWNEHDEWPTPTPGCHVTTKVTTYHVEVSWFFFSYTVFFSFVIKFWYVFQSFLLQIVYHRLHQGYQTWGAMINRLIIIMNPPTLLVLRWRNTRTRTKPTVRVMDLDFKLAGNSVLVVLELFPYTNCTTSGSILYILFTFFAPLFSDIRKDWYRQYSW